MAESISVTSTTTDPRSLEIAKEDLVVRSLYKLSEDLTTFLGKPEGYDVKLEIGKGSEVEIFYAHSAILRARSTYFYKALSKDVLENKTTVDEENGSTVSYIYTAISKTFFMSTDVDNVVVFKKENITPKAFKFLLNIIYGGFTKADGLTAPEFLDLLEAYGELGIRGFEDYLQQSFLENHGEWIRENLFVLEKFSSSHEAFRDVRDYCLDQLCQNSDLVFKPSDVKAVNKNVIIALLKRDDLIAEEIDLWNFILQWAFAQVPDLSETPADWTKEEVDKLKEALKELIPLIRFKWITHEVFFDKVRPYKVLFDNVLYEKVMKHYFSTKHHAPHPTPPPLNTDVSSISHSTPESASAASEPASAFLEPTSAVSESSSVSSFREPRARDKQANLIINEDDNYASLMSCWIDKKPYGNGYQSYNFKCLYRGSTNKFSYATFHEKCDSVLNTLVIARIKETGELVGGFNPRRWNPKDVSGRNAKTYSIYCAKSFIFKINKDEVEKSIISRIKETSNALRYKKESGPDFYDLAIYDRTTPISYDQKFYDTDLNIEGRELDDYEVYRVLPNYSKP